MVVWQGITAGGTAVPVQVTEQGEVVSATNVPVPGPPGEPGPPGPPGPYGPGDDVEFGTITASGTFAGQSIELEKSSGSSIVSRLNGNARFSVSSTGDVRVFDEDGNQNIELDSTGGISALGAFEIGDTDTQLETGSGVRLDAEKPNVLVQRPAGSSGNGVYISCYLGDVRTFRVSANGALSAAENSAGFDGEGTLFFTSRGARYRCVVQGGLMVPELFTREMEVAERIERERNSERGDTVKED